MRDRRLKSLDGIRFFAILSVVLYHYIPYFVSGGFLGVDIFLVLSGFLLGSSLLSENGDSFKYVSYILKKVIRLTVPLVAMLIFSIAFFTIFDTKFLFNIKTTIYSSLLYINNYIQILSGASYFENFINPSPFVHLWYLAVQMQLYIITPLIFWVGRRLLGDNKKIGILFFAIACVSAILMAFIFTAQTDPSRVYFGTDTRGFSFFIGVATAFLLSDRPYVVKRGRNLYSKRKNESIIKVSIFFVVLSLISIMIFTMKDGATFTYRGGIFIFDILVAVLIALLKDLYIGEKILGFFVFEKLGKVSYSVYLWYYPVFSYFTFGSLATTFIGRMWYVQVILLFILGIVFYLIFEENLTKKILSNNDKTMQKRGYYYHKEKKTTIKGVLIFLVLCVALFGTVTAKSGKNETVSQMEKRIANEQRKIAEAKEKERLKAGKDIEDIEGLDRKVMLFSREQEITFFGDSILLSCASSINNVFPKSYIDGAVGRQLYNSSPTIEALKNSDRVYDTVVIILGTNGSFTNKQLDEFVNTIGKEKNIIFLTTFVPRSWQESVNSTLRSYAKKKKRVWIFDWHNELSKNQQWLGQDGVHLNQEGSKALANFIANEYYEIFDKDHKVIKEAKKKIKK